MKNLLAAKCLRFLGFCSLAFLLIATHPSKIHGQSTFHGLIHFHFPQLTSNPPITTGMPYDVLMTYIYVDSLCRNVYGNTIDSVINQMGNPYMSYVAKYLYETVDYDPVRFYQWRWTDLGNRYVHTSLHNGASPGFINSEVGMRIHQKNIFADSQKTELFLQADYIADVQVNYTVEGSHPGAFGLPLHMVKVTSTVLDPIKGQVLPDCTPDPGVPIIKEKQQEGKIADATGGCLQFQYAYNWLRLGMGLNRQDSLGNYYTIVNDSTFGDSVTGYRWIQPDSEYIVLLSLTYDRDPTDSGRAFASLLPIRWSGSCGGMYPVRNGHVYDPYNDFGFGTGLTVAQFKAALRNKIYSITHP